jgi:transposase
MTVEGSTTQKVFEAYVEQFLAPTLKPGQVVIVDNLGAHKGQKVRQLIESRAASVIFLPAYSRRTSIRSKKPSRRSKRSSRRWQRVPARRSL